MTRRLFSEKQIRNRVYELGQDITRDMGGLKPLVLPLLRGSFMFAADLVREIDLPMKLEFIGASSYGSSRESSGSVQLAIDLLGMSVEDQDVLIVEDIVDTGRTIETVLKLLHSRRARSVRVCTLLDKPSKRRVDVPVNYVGFVIDDLFVYGYGLDLDGECRNLPHVMVAEPAE